jgi:hypothetical protein
MAKHVLMLVHSRDHFTICQNQISEVGTFSHYQLIHRCRPLTLAGLAFSGPRINTARGQYNPAASSVYISKGLMPHPLVRDRNQVHWKSPRDVPTAVMTIQCKVIRARTAYGIPCPLLYSSPSVSSCIYLIDTPCFVT